MNREEWWRQQVRPTNSFYPEQKVTDKWKLLPRLQSSHGKMVYVYEWDPDLQKTVGRWVDTRSGGGEERYSGLNSIPLSLWPVFPAISFFT